MGGSYEDERSWYLVSYASPFAGVTNSDDLKKDSNEMAGSQKSYGFWMVPPDIGNQVLVAFTNGDTAKGYWFACIWQQNMNHMVPAIASNVPTDPALQNGIDGNLPPVVEYNKYNTSVNPEDPQRPIFEPLHEAFKSQGLYSDDERGPSSASARREAPSQVYGFITPSGHNLHFDDKEGIARLRTANGVQIMLNDKTGYIYAVTKQGNSWLELSDEGIDAFSSKSISLASEQDINLRAGGNINMDAGAAIAMRAGSTVGIQSGADTNVKSGAKLAMESAGDTSVKSGGALVQSASGNISEKAGGNHIRTAGTILDNSGGSAPAAPAVGAQEGGTLSGVNTTVSRMPTHEPWPYHPKEGLTDNPDAPTVTTGNGEGGDKKSIKNLQAVTTGSGVKKIMDKTIKDTSPIVNIGKYKVSTKVLNAIKEGASISGQPLGYMMAKAAQESNFDPNIKASTSSATGLYQFTNKTWEGMVNKYGSKYGIGMNDRTDPRANAVMGGLFARDNAAYLKSRGLTTTNTDLYMAHFLGANGASSFLSAKNRDPNAPAYVAVGQAAAKANKSVFYDRSGNPRSNAQVYTLFQNKIEPNAIAFAKAYGGTGQG